MTIEPALIKRRVEKNRDYLAALISSAVKISSYSGESEAIQLFLKQELESLGLETRMTKVDPERLEKYKGFTYDGFPYDNRYNLIGVKKGKGGGGKSLMLNGHVDIVPPGDPAAWDEDPLSGLYKNGNIYGRGSLDMKSGLAAIITAVKVLQEIGFEPAGDIIFSSVCGEETGGCGAFGLVEDGITADGCIILEPTSLKICHIQSGCHTFKLKVKGRSIHACMAYKGVNAIDKFNIIYDALKKMDRRRHERFNGEQACYYETPDNVAPLNVGTIQGGEWPSSVPDQLEAHGRIGIFPGETVEEMHREFEETVSNAAAGDAWLKENRPVVEWYEGLFEPAGIDADSALIKTLAASHEQILGRKVQLEAVTYGSDMRIFNLYANIPTVLYGQGDVSVAHTVNEHVRIDDVLEAVASLAMMIVNWCG